MEQELWVTFVWCAVGYRCDSCAWSAYYMPGHEPSLKHRIPHLACKGGRPVVYRMFSHKPGLYSLDASKGHIADSAPTCWCLPPWALRKAPTGSSSLVPMVFCSPVCLLLPGLPSILGLKRSPGEGNGNPLQYSCLENFVDRGAWRAAVHGVAESRARPSARHSHSVHRVGSG